MVVSLYLAVILDLFSRLVVGWAMSTRITHDLALDALGMALARRGRPRGLSITPIGAANTPARLIKPDWPSIVFRSA